MRYLGVSIAAGVCLLAAGAVSADEIRLGDNELDAVTAGLDLGFEPADFSLTSSPLLQQAAGIIVVELDNAFVQEETNGGASLFVRDSDGGIIGLANPAPSPNIGEQPVIGPATLGLLDFALTIEPIEFPFGLTPPPPP